MSVNRLTSTCVRGRKRVQGKPVLPKSQVFGFRTFLTLLQGRFFACSFPVANRGPQTAAETKPLSLRPCPLLAFSSPLLSSSPSHGAGVQAAGDPSRRGTILLWGVLSQWFLRHMGVRRREACGRRNEGEQNVYLFLMLYLL